MVDSVSEPRFNALTPFDLNELSAAYELLREYGNRSAHMHMELLRKRVSAECCGNE